MYVITGATGNIGSKIAEALLGAGQKVRLIARDEDRLKVFSQKGAEVVPGSLEDAAFLRRIFEDAKAVFTMIPTDIHAQNVHAYMDTIGEAIATALEVSKVPYVVNLSSLGAEHPSGTGPIAGLHRQEERLNRLKESRLLHLRPTYFMENFLTSIPLIKHMGINGSALRSDHSMGMIATRDIADVATKALLHLDFPERQIHMLLGPRDYTMAEATRILGEAIGKPDLQYVQFPYEDFEKALIDAGISPSVAKSYAEMEGALNSGLVGGYKREPENTTPTTLEEFSKVFAEVYRA
jgi:uncharacterized protein YbjT (DUF2867 family)